MGPERERGWREDSVRRSGAKLWIDHIQAVAIGVAKVQAACACDVEFTRWAVIAQVVPAIVGKPKRLGFRVPSKTHRVSHTVGKRFE